MENHKAYQNMIKPFLGDKLSMQDRRKFIFHLDTCAICKDMLLEEYMFHVIFNDKDKDINSSYTDKLDELLNEEKNIIIESDSRLYMQYILLSIVIIVCLFIIASLGLSIMLR